MLIRKVDVAEDNMLPLPIAETSSTKSDMLNWRTIHRLMFFTLQPIAQTFARVEVNESSGRAWFVPSIAAQLVYPDDLALGQAYMRGELVQKPVN